MAKKIRVMEAQPMWVEPPVTKEEALNPYGSPNGAYQKDGYDGGNELPDDFDIDRMVYPHAEGPDEVKARERRAKREGDIEAFQAEAEQESREFEIGRGSPLGEGGVLSPFEEEKED